MKGMLCVLLSAHDPEVVEEVIAGYGKISADESLEPFCETIKVRHCMPGPERLSEHLV